MNLAEYALNNRALVKFLIAVLVVGGIFSFVQDNSAVSVVNGTIPCITALSYSNW